MKKITPKSSRRKLVLRAEAVAVLTPPRLTVVVGGVLQPPPQHPHSPLNGCTPPRSNFCGQ